ncbi:MAG TPA: cellulase family glycosylhydrolase, partial [Rhabdaerophilum sp.]|nr:cellulase family glycosylhydrolase [Rhabdaerophilum sp.]
NHDDGTGFPLMFYVRREWQRTIAFWVEMARRYRDEPAILAYELLNEPISTYHDEDTLNPMLEPFYREATAAIRRIDPKRIIILAGAQWDQNFRVFGPPFAENLVYVYHQFWSSTRQDAVQEYVNFSLRNNVPVLLGEAGEFNNRWNHDYRLLNERNRMGWSYWTYKNLNSPTTIASIRAPAGWDKIAALASMPDPTLEKAGLTRTEARTILDAYLEAIHFRSVEIRPCYLRSLGLAPDLEAACAEQKSMGKGG